MILFNHSFTVDNNQYGKGVAKALGIDYEEALKAEDPAHPTWDPRNKK